ncbi:MAG TPA: serpin family protein, partial [Candidatus Limnocylindrales bacterium]|nr:serpin family protein [Candidatus Limnocylindrales bacterium]
AITEAVGKEQARLQRVRHADPEDCGTYAYETRLFMPRFGIETRAQLSKQLRAMGMPDAFSLGVADLSALSTEAPLYISTVVHQANIDVDERGTEAAAATAVGVDTGGCTRPAPRTEKTLRLNRPFMFFIRDLETGAILFMGRVTDPTAR